MYNHNKLKAMAVLHGVDNVPLLMAQIFDLNIQSARRKLRMGIFTVPESVLLCEKIGFTPNEYMELFYYDFLSEVEE